MCNKGEQYVYREHIKRLNRSKKIQHKIKKRKNKHRLYDRPGIYSTYSQNKSLMSQYRQVEKLQNLKQKQLKRNKKKKANDRIYKKLLEIEKKNQLD